MKPKRLPKFAMTRAYLLLAIVVAITSIVSAITNDPRLMYALGMVAGVQLWWIIKEIYEEYFDKSTDEDTTLINTEVNLSSEEFDEIVQYLEEMKGRQQK